MEKRRRTRAVRLLQALALGASIGVLAGCTPEIVGDYFEHATLANILKNVANNAAFPSTLPDRRYPGFCGYGPNRQVLESATHHALKAGLEPRAAEIKTYVDGDDTLRQLRERVGAWPFTCDAIIVTGLRYRFNIVGFDRIREINVETPWFLNCEEARTLVAKALSVINREITDQRFDADLANLEKHLGAARLSIVSQDCIAGKNTSFIISPSWK